MGYFLYLLPRRALSRLMGCLLHLRLPGTLRRLSIQVFARLYKINLAESELPISEYQSIGDFFVRKLKPGARPLGTSEIVHPADSKLTQSGNLKDGLLIQAKGLYFRIHDFLGLTKESCQRFLNGEFATYYLCPTDYHRVHSPLAGKIKKARVIPGDLWPVNDWSTRSIPGLFSINERIVIEIETPKGPAAVVLVGATNVGQMTLTFWPEIRTNQTSMKIIEKDFDLVVQKGDELGMFHMGSTVVVVYSQSLIPHDWNKRPLGKFVNVSASFFESRTL